MVCPQFQIPQTKFANTSISNKAAIVHNLYNLGLLPKKENILKRNKSLIEITDPWLISQIKEYEDIEKTDFEKYSNIGNFEQLKEQRGKLYKSAFNQERNWWLNN